MIQFNCSLQTTGASWPTGTLDALKALLVEQLVITLRGSTVRLAKLPDLIHSCHVVQPPQFDGGLVRLNVTFREARAVLDCVPDLLAHAPLFARLPATSYAAAVTSASTTGLLPPTVKMTVALFESSWLAASLQELYTTVRVYPGALLTPNMVQIILQTYNTIVPNGPLFESVEAISVDMTQGVLVKGLPKGEPLGGNDYVAVLKHCKSGYFDQVVKLVVPLKAMFAGWDPAVVAALPVTKEVNIVKTSYKSQGLKRQQQQRHHVVTKKQRTHRGSVATSVAATDAAAVH